MDNCRQTLEDLELTLKKVNNVEDGGFLRRAKRQITLDKQEEGIKMYRKQITSYREAMQFALQLISVYPPSSTLFTESFRSLGMKNEQLNAQVVSKLDTMALEINLVLQQFRHRRRSATTEPVRAVFQNLESCVRAAGTLVSSASTVMTNRSNRTESVTPSLSTRQIAAIKTWVEAVVPSFPPINEESDSVASLSNVSSEHTSVQPDEAGTRVTPAIEPKKGSFANLENRRIEYWWKSGKKKFEAREYEDAEKFLGKAYTESGSRASQFKGWDELELMLVISHCKLGNFHLAETKVLKILREKSESEPLLVSDNRIFDLVDVLVSKYCEAERLDDASRVLTEAIAIKKENDIFYFDSQLTLAEICLRKHDTANAQTYCREIFDEAEASSSEVTSSLHFESILLMTLICYANDDPVEAEGYKALLPADYQGTKSFFS